jgi:hypothetical protein
MKNRMLVQFVAFVVVAVFAAGIWLTGDQVKVGWLRFYSVAVLAAVGLVALWDRWLWRLPVAQRFASVPSDLNGTWKGVQTSLWVDPATGESPKPKAAFLVVRQTSSKISVVLFTDESRSRSSLAAVTSRDGITSLGYFYLNLPDSRHRDRSPIHSGSVSLDVTGRPASRLKGKYWTDRDSRGELDFKIRSRTPVDDYDQAVLLFEALAR